MFKKTRLPIIPIAGFFIAVSILGTGVLLGLGDPSSNDAGPRPGVPLDPGPPFAGIVNGIEIVPISSEAPSHGYCQGSAENAAYAVVIGTEFEIVATYLPPGAVEHGAGYSPDPEHDDFVPVTLCDGLTARSYREWRYVGLDSAWIELSITKLTTDAMVIDAREDRISQSIINGASSILIRPASRDDLRRAYLIIKEPFGQTRIMGFGLDEDELMRVAEGVER